MTNKTKSKHVNRSLSENENTLGGIRVKSDSQHKILQKYHSSQDWVISFNANTVI